MLPSLWRLTKPASVKMLCHPQIITATSATTIVHNIHKILFSAGTEQSIFDFSRSKGVLFHHSFPISPLPIALGHTGES